MRNRYLIALILVLLIFLSAVFALPKFLVGQRTLPNLLLEGIEVGNLNPDELTIKIDEAAKSFEEKQVKFVYDNHIKTLSLKNLGVVPLTENTFNQIYNYGKTGFIFQRWYYIFHSLRNSTSFALQNKLDKDKAYSTLFEFVKEYSIKPQDAKLIIGDNEEITLVPAVVGEQANILDTIEQLEDIINSGQELAGKEIKINAVKVNPDITDEDIKNMHITGKIVEVTTYFNAANKERTHNIKIASNKLQDYLIPPGAIFSFNDSVGPRTKEAGYKDAMIIVENEFEPGLGGGICQLSSTIYQAALKANLSIVERRRHSLLVNYVPPGLDATVVYGFLDFKFQNNTDGYLWLKTEVKNNSLTVKIFGWKEKAPNISISRSETKIDPPVEIIEDPSLPKGQEVVEKQGGVGYQVQVIRIVKDNDGNVLSQEIVSKDTYPPEKRVIRVGLKDVAPPEKEETVEQEEQIEENPAPDDILEEENS